MVRLALLLTLVLLASPAAAQVGELGEPASEAPAPAGPRLGLDDARLGAPSDGMGETFAAWGAFSAFGGSLGGQSATLLGVDAGMRMRMLEVLDVDLAWGFVWASARVQGVRPTDDGGEEAYEADVERVEAGNPTFTLRFHTDREAGFYVQAGLGASVPMAAQAQVPGPRSTAGSHAEHLASVTVLDAWLAMNGGWDPWRYLPERFSLFAPIRVGGSAGLFGWSIDAALGLGVGVLGGRRDTDAMLQLAGDVAFEIVPELRAGARLGVSAWALGTDVAEAQPFAEPWLRLCLGPFFATARGTLALGGHRGFGAEGGGAWSVSLAAGASYEER